MRFFQFLVLLLWGISLALLYVCVFEGYDLSIGEYDRLANAFYLALVPPTWALAVSWIVFACIIDYGGKKLNCDLATWKITFLSIIGPINWFLSLPVFQVLSKLTYCIFLIHTLVIVITDAQTRSSIEFSHAKIVSWVYLKAHVKIYITLFFRCMPFGGITWLWWPFRLFLLWRLNHQ